MNSEEAKDTITGLIRPAVGSYWEFCENGALFRVDEILEDDEIKCAVLFPCADKSFRADDGPICLALRAFVRLPKAKPEYVNGEIVGWTRI